MKLVKIIHCLLAFTLLSIPLLVTRQFVFAFTPEKTFLFFFLVEFTFALWLYLIWTQKQYRPSKNAILLSGLVFLVIFSIAGIVGVDPSNSFWSSISRMSGLLLLYHIGIFTLILASIVRDQKTWRLLLTASVFSATIISIISFFEPYGLHFFQISSRNGSLIGNSSYAGAYLAVNFFIALFLAQSNSVQKYKKLFRLSAVLIFISPILFQVVNIPQLMSNPFGILGDARSASAALIIGAVLYGALRINSTLAKIGGILIAVATIFALTLTFIPNSVVQNFFDLQHPGTRLILWEATTEGVSDRPLLGWGPENYSHALYQNFSPSLYSGEFGAGKEADTDKPHNMYLEIAVTGGILSLASYLLFFFFIYRELAQRPRENAAFIAGLSALLIQNILFFDTLVSFMMFSLIAAYAISENSGSYPETELKQTPMVTSFFVGATLIFCFVFVPITQQSELRDIFVRPGTVGHRALLEKYPHQTSIHVYLLEKTWDEFQNKEKRENERFQKHIRDLYIAIEPETEKYRENYRAVSMWTRLVFTEAIITGDPRTLSSIPELIDQLLILSPNNPEPYWFKAQYELLKGEKKNALTTLETAKSLFPEAPQAAEFIELIKTSSTNPIII